MALGNQAGNPQKSAKRGQNKPTMNSASTASPPGNRTLASARAAKQDEFYTQLPDIENELKHYVNHFRGKVVLCNCDDPYESNFFQYFALKFNSLRLKKLVCTSYAGSPIAGSVLPFEEYAGHKPNGKQARVIEITKVEDLNADGTADMADVEYLLRTDGNTWRRLHGDDEYGAGDFRSKECVALLKDADIVVTNPPFSLFREYVADLVEHERQFLIIGNKNSITLKEFFKLIREDKVWIGVTPMGSDLLFDVPENVAKAMVRSGKEGSNYKIVDGKVKGRSTSSWFTNMDNPKRHEHIALHRKYSPAEYPKYANFDAIEVSRVVDIPVNYRGAMGVPITFLDKYNPDQFEILGSSMTLGVPMAQVAKRGTFLQGGPRFYLDNGNGTYRRMYDRIVIRVKRA